MSVCFRKSNIVMALIELYANYKSAFYHIRLLHTNRQMSQKYTNLYDDNAICLNMNLSTNRNSETLDLKL